MYYNRFSSRQVFFKRLPKWAMRKAKKRTGYVLLVRQHTTMVWQETPTTWHLYPENRRFQMVLKLKFKIRKESDIFSLGKVYSVKSKFCFREAFKFNTKISVSLMTHNGLKHILNIKNENYGICTRRTCLKWVTSH